MVRPALANEPDRDKRQELDVRANEVLDEHMNPLHLDAAQVIQRGARDLGFANYLELYRKALPTSALDDLAEQCRHFLDSTQLLYENAADKLFRTRVGVEVWAGVVLSIGGLAMLSGVPAGSTEGNLLVLVSTTAQAMQIVMVERYARRFDAIALTLTAMATSCACFLVIALARGDLPLPRGWTVWGALLVTGIFASALSVLIQVWAQRRMSAARIALVFALETVWAGIFGYWLSGDRLGWLGWGGCAAILAGIVLAEPAAAAMLRRLNLLSSD